MIRISGNRFFPRDKGEALARKSCSNRKLVDEPDPTQSKPALESRRNAPSQHDRGVESRIRPDVLAERGLTMAL
jgi:hypothetical protein